MSRLTRDGTAEPVSLETKFSGVNERGPEGKKNVPFPCYVQLTLSRIGNHYPVDPYSAENYGHTHS